MVQGLDTEKFKVVLFEGIHQSAVDVFQKNPCFEVHHLQGARSGDELQETIRDAHIIGVRSRTHIRKELLPHAKNLFGIGCFCIGTNQVDLEDACNLGIPVFNAPHSNTRSVAELVIAEIVMLLRGIGDKSRAAHEQKWTKSATNSFEVRGKKLGIVGYGHIGSQVSILAEAFGMQVSYYDVNPKLPMGNARQVDSLETLINTVDILTLHVPDRPDTINLMNRERIGAMKEGAILLNLSRGRVVDLNGLKEALQSGRLMGAGIDVLPTEPSSNDATFVCDLQELPNVILTPHIGGSTQEAQVNIGVEVATKISNYVNQGATIGAVNFPNISLAPHHDSHRLLHVHQNRPGVLGAINQVLAEANANIVGQHLQTQNDVGYVVTDVDKDHAPDLHAKLSVVEGTIRCRMLS